MKYLKPFRNYLVTEGTSAYQFANNLEAKAANRLLTKDEREDFENKIYNKIGMAAMGIYDKLMAAIKKQNRTELTEQDYETALQMLADRLKRELKPADYIPNDEPDPSVVYTYTDTEQEPMDNILLPEDDDEE